MNFGRWLVLLLLAGFFIGVVVGLVSPSSQISLPIVSPVDIADTYTKLQGGQFGDVKVTISPTQTITPTPRPLTFAELNKLYGPCAVVPALIFHHVEDLELAKAEKHESLTVGTPYFKADLQYLKDHGYTTVTTGDVIAFFDSGTPLPPKSILLTFDDGYADFAGTVYPLLQEFGAKATAFISTGLLENPGYMTWSQLADMKGSGLMEFANHTWSHHSVVSSGDVVEKEIAIADTQLHEHGLGEPKVFAYPYGPSSAAGEASLRAHQYLLAFTTRPGRTLCKGQRLDLPRVRVGNASLAAYGF